MTGESLNTIIETLPKANKEGDRLTTDDVWRVALAHGDAAGHLMRREESDVYYPLLSESDNRNIRLIHESLRRKVEESDGVSGEGNEMGLTIERSDTLCNG